MHTRRRLIRRLRRLLRRLRRLARVQGVSVRNVLSRSTALAGSDGKGFSGPPAHSEPPAAGDAPKKKKKKAKQEAPELDSAAAGPSRPLAAVVSDRFE